MYVARPLVIKTKSLSQEYSCWGIGDIHLLNRGCHEKLLDKTIERIAADPFAMWWGLGDYVDLISTADKRWDPEGVAEKDRKAYFQKLGPYARDRIIEKFDPIADKCCGMIVGNHEWSYENRFEQAIVGEVVNTWNDELRIGKGDRFRGFGPVQFLGYSAFRDLIFTRGSKEVRLTNCLHHGAGYAQTRGGKLNRLIKFMRQFVAHLFWMGHVHEITDDAQVQVSQDSDKEGALSQVMKRGIITGTYLRTYTVGPSGYGERKMYDPAPLGSPCVMFVPGDWSFRVEKPW